LRQLQRLEDAAFEPDRESPNGTTDVAAEQHPGDADPSL
jgi:hypothetical protein